MLERTDNVRNDCDCASGEIKLVPTRLRKLLILLHSERVGAVLHSYKPR
jgi:hypothetical protein